MKLDDYVDVDEAAGMLNIHPESVRRLIRNGKIPAIKAFDKWLIDRPSMAQYASGYNGKPGSSNESFLPIFEEKPAEKVSSTLTIKIVTGRKWYKRLLGKELEVAPDGDYFRPLDAPLLAVDKNDAIVTRINYEDES